MAVPYVPVIDLCDDPTLLVGRLDEVCREVGFFQVVGHGVDEPGEQWPKDRWRSTLHRVTDPPTANDGSSRRRFSMQFFHNANWDARVSCLPTCHAPGEAPKYPTVVAVPHLRAKFRRSVEKV